MVERFKSSRRSHREAENSKKVIQKIVDGSGGTVAMQLTNDPKLKGSNPVITGTRW
jgi:hypothetical protein